MVSAAETMSALGWQGMRNKRPIFVAVLLAAATLVIAQVNTSNESPSDSVAQAENERLQAPSGTGTRNSGELGDTNSPREDSANGTNAPVSATNAGVAAQSLESTKTEDAAVTSATSEDNEPLVAADDYRATERISEDRSVSFPVDI